MARASTWVGSLLVWLCGGLLLLSPAHAVEMGIFTSSAVGTYYQIGRDMRTLLAEHGITLHVYPSEGSLENLFKVYNASEVQLGIAHADGLAFLATTGDRNLQRMARQIKVVFPLYNSEVHVVTRAETGITKFTDLDGKIVTIGPENNGTRTTADFLLKLAGVQPAKTVTLDFEDMLHALRKKDVDAMFYVAGAPIGLFRDVVTADDQLRFVPITEKSLTEFYTRVVIPAGTYPWQSTDVATVGVQSILVSFDYKGAYCEHVGQVAKMLYDHIDWLRQHGHPKWKTVDLAAPLQAGWERYDCVERALGTPPTAPRPADGARNPITEALKNMLKKP